MRCFISVALAISLHIFLCRGFVDRNPPSLQTRRKTMNKNIQTRPFSNSFRQPVPLRLAADDGGDDDALTDGISPASISSERSRLEASFCGKGEDGDSSPRSEFCDSGEESDASIARELLTLLQDMKRRKKSDPESKQMYGMLKSKLLDSPKARGEFLSRSRVEGFDVGGLDLGMELLPKGE